MFLDTATPNGGALRLDAFQVPRGIGKTYVWVPGWSCSPADDLPSQRASAPLFHPPWLLHKDLISDSMLQPSDSEDRS